MDEGRSSITFIRHGKTAANVRRAYIGATDEPLSEEGKRELLSRKRAGAYPPEEQVGRVFISPMLRCRQSAEILFPHAGLIVIPEWREIDFGDFEGKNYNDLNGNPAYQAWIDSNGQLPFPNGESREQFTARTMRGYERMKTFFREGTRLPEASGQKPREEAAVVHGGTIMALFSALYGGDYYDYLVGNGELMQLKESL